MKTMTYKGYTAEIIYSDEMNVLSAVLSILMLYPVSTGIPMMSCVLRLRTW